MKQRQVVIGLKTWLVVSVPDDWDEHQIEFFFNESCHCSGNEIQQLADEDNRVPHSCVSCFRTEVEYLREATEDDKDDTRWKDPG